MATYQVTDPTGKVHTRVANDGFTHAIIRQFKDGEPFKLSLASSHVRAGREMASRKNVEGYVLELGTDGTAEAPQHDDDELSPLELAVEDDADELEEIEAENLQMRDLWQSAFEAGKEYALKCAFQGVEDAPVNPYA